MADKASSQRNPLAVRGLVIVFAIQLILGGALLVLAATDFAVFRSDDDEPAKAPAAAPAASAPAAAARKANRFDGRRAFAELKRQVALGPRPAGSATSRKLAEQIRAKLPRGAFEAVPGGLRNVVGRVPGKRPAIVVGAHYDTKDIPGFVGAEDGAGGTAAVMELARVFSRKGAWPKDAPELRFVLFDGEESPDDSLDFYISGLRGSRAYAKKHAKDIRAVIVLDFVAQKDLAIPYEPGSDPELWARLRAAAATAGVADVFPDTTQGEITDDHTPFARRGIPAIDLIDFDFPCWHKTCDDLDVVSEASLDKSGEAVVQLLRDLAKDPI